MNYQERLFWLKKQKYVLFQFNNYTLRCFGNVREMWKNTIVQDSQAEGCGFKSRFPLQKSLQNQALTVFQLLGLFLFQPYFQPSRRIFPFQANPPKPFFAAAVGGTDLPSMQARLGSTTSLPGCFLVFSFRTHRRGHQCRASSLGFRYSEHRRCLGLRTLPAAPFFDRAHRL